MPVRLQKYLADCGIASRRIAEKIILAGKVKVNNKIVKELGTKVEPGKDIVHCYNKEIKLPTKLVYLMLNKPRGYITTDRDPQNRKTVMDLLPQDLKVHAVGRLDKESAGLLILTNDGELNQKLTHPKHKHEKEYVVKVDKVIRDKVISLLKKGIRLEEGIAKADKIARISDVECRMVLHQGWKRQIRRMFEALDYKVINLERIRVGKLKLGRLLIGKYKFVEKKDIVDR